MPWWRLPNVVALDVPLIALVWQRVFMQPQAPSWAEMSALFFSIWAIYLADRLMDARLFRNLPSAMLPQRHQVFRRCQGVFFLFFIGTLLAGGMSVFFLPVKTLLAGLAVAGAVGMYLLWNQSGSQAPGRRWFKEAVIAVIFAIGCALTSWTKAPLDTWITGILVLAAIGWLNCLQIAAAECRFDQISGNPTLAADPKYQWFIFSLGPRLFFAGAMLWLLMSWKHPSSITVAAMTAGGLFCLTGTLAKRYGTEAAATWADAAILVSGVVALAT